MPLKSWPHTTTATTFVAYGSAPEFAQIMNTSEPIARKQILLSNLAMCLLLHLFVCTLLALTFRFAMCYVYCIAPTILARLITPILTPIGEVIPQSMHQACACGSGQRSREC
mmetsp:Transcript_62934/g.103865  ORF Transcript_62934/g.103865 Transcript_62934/m.103865 type:complete len:112 (-) Transcript_62934:635-970(-)